jgi:zinc protease
MPGLRLIPISLLLLAAAPVAGAQQRMPPDPAIATGVLPNGLHYYVRANNHPAHRAELRLIVNAGSVLEDSDQAGLAHFVEHMAFNGTAHFPKQALTQFIERIGMTFGADLNAETSFDDTRYRLTVPTDSAGLVEQGLQVLEDWAGAVTFDTAEIRKERGVVIEEWRMGQGAGSRLLNRTFPVLLQGSRYAERLPIGNLQSLQHFNPKALLRFYRDWYRPDLMAVVAVGDFNRDSVVALIRHGFGAIQGRTSKRPRRQPAVPDRTSTGVVVATDPEATRTVVQLQVLRPAQTAATIAAFRSVLVARLYGDMVNQRLSELAQRPDPPFVGASAGQGGLVRPVEEFSVGALVTGQGVLRGFEASLAELERIHRYGFVPPEFDRSRRNLQKDFDNAYAERGNTESGDYADDCAENFLTGSSLSDIATVRAIGDSLLPGITLEEVNQAAQRWLENRNRVIALTAPDRVRDSLPGPSALLAVLDSVAKRPLQPYAEQLSNEPLVTADLPEAAIVSETVDTTNGVTRWTLANGVRVVLKPTDFKADEVQLAGFSPGGVSRAPDSLVTAAAFVGAAIAAGGLGRYDAVDLEKKLAGRRAGVGPWIGAYEEGISGGASPSDLDQLFQLIWLLFTAPRVDSAAFDVMHRNALTQLAQQEVDPGRAFRDTLSVTLGQHHPWTAPLTAARADSVTIGRVYGLFDDRFADAADFTFVLVGSFQPDTVRPLVRRYLGNLPALHRDNSARDPGLSTPKGVVIREVHKGLAARSRTAIVFSGDFTWTRRERGLMDGVTRILEDRLRNELREELGGTYSVNVSGQPSRVPHPAYKLSIEYGSAPERVEELAAEVLREVDSLRATGPTAEEVANWKEAVRRRHQVAVRENDYWLSVLSSSISGGESLAELLDPESWLAPATTSDLQQAATRFLDPSRYVRVTLLPGDSSSH